MNIETLKKMVSFGFSSKGEENHSNNAPNGLKSRDIIGRFGNGFKSSSMRIANNCLIVTKTASCQKFSVAFLSYDFLKNEGISNVKVPICQVSEGNLWVAKSW